MICIYITEQCNLDCGYCYVKKKKSLMDAKTLNRFLDFLDTLNFFSRERRIIFIGGEPLLFPGTIREFSEIIDKRYPGKVSFEITTNLTLFNNEIEELVKGGKYRLFPSIDGTETSHNAFRKDHSGVGSYQKVIRNLSKLAKHQNCIKIIYTYDPDKPGNDFVGFVKSILNISEEVDWRFSIRSILQKRDELLEFYHEENLKLVNFFLEQLETQKRIINIEIINAALTILEVKEGSKKINDCPLGYSSFGIFPNGDLWPCAEYYSQNGRMIGNVNHDSYEQLTMQVKKLRVLNHAVRALMAEKPCNCKGSEFCSKSVCIADYERSNQECPINLRFKFESAVEISQLIEKRVSKDDREIILKKLRTPT